MDAVPHDTYDNDGILFDTSLTARQRKPKTRRNVSLLTVLHDLPDLKCTVVDLLLLIIKGENEFGGYCNALFSSAPSNRASLTKLFDTLIQDNKGGPIMREWMSLHSVHLVCENIETEMEDAKCHLRMNTADVTPDFIEQWDIYKIMKMLISDLSALSNSKGLTD
jgi:hypothetical protein